MTRRRSFSERRADHMRRQAARSSRWTPANVVRAVIVLAILALFGAALAIGTHPHEHAETFEMQVRTIETVLVLAFGYYFGSSQGSQDKTDHLAHGQTAGLESFEDGFEDGFDGGFSAALPCPRCGYPNGGEASGGTAPGARGDDAPARGRPLDRPVSDLRNPT